MILLASLLLLYQQPSSGSLTLGVPQVQVQEENRFPSHIRELTYEVEVLGFLAQTTVTVAISNSSPLGQEVSLLQKLPPNSVVDGFQLGIEDVMVDGVVQEKHLARIGFDREKRKRVDPGLIEWVDHDLYRIRVFPISADKPRKIRFRYLTPLTESPKGSGFQLDFTKLDKRTKLEIVLHQKDRAVLPDVKGSFGASTAKNRFQKTWRMSAVGPALQPLHFLWPKGERPSLMVTRDLEAWHFALQTNVAKPAGKRLANPQRVAVFWDASGSRIHQAVAKEVEALFRLIAFRNPQHVALIRFRDRAEEPVLFEMTRSGKNALKQALTSVNYDGGSNLRGLRVPHQLGAEEVWMFTDGYDTLGLSRAEPFSSVPSFAFTTSSQSHLPFLEDWSQANQGKAILWRNPSEEKLLEIFSESSIHFDGLVPQTGDLLDHQFLHRPARRMVMAAGETTHFPSSFFLTWKLDGRKVLQHVDDLTDYSEAKPWFTRFAAGLTLQKLQFEPDYFRHEIVDLAHSHGLVSQHTSLIVFETLSQYASNGLIPPANAPFNSFEKNDLAPKKPDLEALKKRYFQEALGYWTYSKAESGFVLTLEELHSLPPIRNPWVALFRVPGIQPDKVNNGVNELGARNQVSRTSGQHLVKANDSQPDESLHHTRWAIEDVEFEPESDNPSHWKNVVQDLKSIKSDGKDPYVHYLKIKSRFATDPSFYYQVAHFFAELGEQELARRIVTNLLELANQDDRLLFATGMLCQVLTDYGLAEAAYEKLAKNRPEWPHPRMLVAQIQREKAVLLEKVNPKKAIGLYQRAFDGYQALLLAPWGELDEWDQAHFLRENRFPKILVPIVEELLWLQKRLETLGKNVNLILPSGFNASFEDIKANIRVMLWWGSENANLKLRVIEPLHVEKSVGNRSAYEKKSLLLNQNEGLGPALYRNRHAEPGQYQIGVTNWGSIFNDLLGPIYVKAEVWLNYGEPDEAYMMETLQLDPKRQGQIIILESIEW